MYDVTHNLHKSLWPLYDTQNAKSPKSVANGRLQIRNFRNRDQQIKKLDN